MKFYSKIAKVNDNPDGTIRVYGYASAPVRDAHGEVVTAEAMKMAVDDYMKFPAVREMHDATKAAGRGLEITFDEDDRACFVAHIVDSEAIKKVKAGVYPGFSIGGRVKKRSSQDPTIIQRIDLMEVSLVDRPSCPVATLDLWKRDDLRKDADDGDGAVDGWVDRDKWDDGFDFFGEGGDNGRSSGPASARDGGAFRPSTPGSDTGAGPYAGKGEWEADELGAGGDKGTGQMPTDPNSGKQPLETRPNATVNTAGGAGRAGGGQSSSADYFSGDPARDNLQRIFEMISDLYNAQAVANQGVIQRRAFTAEQRKAAAKSGAAMKDGSYPIENRGDLANAIRAIGRAKNPAAAKAHIKRRAAALGATSMLPDDWGKAADGGAISGQGKSDPASAISKTDDLLKSALESLERLEVRQRRGVATPESYRLAKAYKAMSEDELAEVLASDAIAKVASADEKLAKAELFVAKYKEDNEALLQKLDQTNVVLEQLQQRVNKLAEMPMPTKTAGSIHAVEKSADAGGNGRQPLSEEDAARARAEFAKLSEEDRALLLTKAALSRPRSLNLDPVASPPRSIGGSAGRPDLR